MTNDEIGPGPMASSQNSQRSSTETVIACGDNERQAGENKCPRAGRDKSGHLGEESKALVGLESKQNHTCELHPDKSSENQPQCQVPAEATQDRLRPDLATHLKQQQRAKNQLDGQVHTSTRTKPRGTTIKSVFHLASQHFNIFQLYNERSNRSRLDRQEADNNSNPTATTPLVGPASCPPTDQGQTFEQHQAKVNKQQSSSLMGWTQRYLGCRRRPNHISKSAPVTPIKSASSAIGATCSNSSIACNDGLQEPNGYSPAKVSSLTGFEGSATGRASNCEQQHQAQQTKPSVRFFEPANQSAMADNQHSGGPEKSQAANCKWRARERITFADCGVQTTGEHSMDVVASDGDDDLEGEIADDDNDGMKFVARLFKLPEAGGENKMLAGECPMDSRKFREYGYKLIDYISNYLDTIGKRRVTPINIEPGYLKALIEPQAPEQGESFATIMQDFESKIMCGITHWQHPHFHAYFPAGNAYPSILADMLSDGLGCVGFSWAASPAYTELETIMLDWMGKMIGLPDEFLCLSATKKANNQESRGGGVIQGSASECVLVNLLAARHWAMEKLRKKFPGVPDGILLSRLVGYCSKEAHSCVEKASMIGFIRMRALETDDKNSLRGETLARAIEADKAQGLEPFIVCATLGTTSCVSFDNLEELGQVCRDNDDIWLHVDAAYAGSALICPEFKYLIKGIEMVTSFNMNPNKWMLINFDCSLMWVRDRFKLTRAFVVDPLYLQHSFSDQAIDYRHWGIPLSRRFRALKLWFVIRNYGIEGLRGYIRNHCRLAKLFEQLISADKRFVVTNEVVLGLVCFRLIGSNALNQRILSMINASGKLHMVPASLNGRYVIRFCVCDQNAQEADIHYAYNYISQVATELFESIRTGREKVRAISQQNTIDISSISLHTQQSLSADRLDNSAGANGNDYHDHDESSGAGEAKSSIEASKLNGKLASLVKSHLKPSSGELDQMDRDHEGGHEVGQQNAFSPARSPLIKQVSMKQQQSQTNTSGQTEVQRNISHEDLEKEVPIDSLATIDGCDYDLCLDDDDDYENVLKDMSPLRHGDDDLGTEPMHQDSNYDSIGSTNNNDVYQAQAGRSSRTPATDSSEQGETGDEVFKMAQKRNRMSLRYKRQFFVRVVSDPRVYRASVSGDINAHASTSSLSSNGPQIPNSKQPNHK